MKKLFVFLFPLFAVGQPGKKVDAAKAANQAGVPKNTLSPTEMYVMANVPAQADDEFVIIGAMTAEPSPSGTAKAMYSAMVESWVYGDDKPKDYGVWYTSMPVIQAYDTYIKPNIQTYIDLNDEVFKSGFFKLIIANALADQLMKAVENANVFRTPGCREKLKVEILNEYKNDEFGPKSEDAAYHKDHLFNIWARMSTILTQAPMPIDAPYTGSNSNPVQNTGLGVTYNDFQSSFFFLCGSIAASNCAIAVIIAKSKINMMKANSPFTQLLDKAKWGTLYQPLVSYINQSSFYDLYKMNVSYLQTLTSGNALYLLYDKENNCFNQVAYELAEKIRSASVFNSK